MSELPDQQGGASQLVRMRRRIELPFGRDTSWLHDQGRGESRPASLRVGPRASRRCPGRPWAPRARRGSPRWRLRGASTAAGGPGRRGRLAARLRPRLEHLPQVEDQALRAGVVGLVLVEDPAEARLDGLPERGDGLEEKGVVEVAPASPQPRDAHQGQEEEPGLLVGSGPGLKGDAPRSRFLSVSRPSQPRHGPRPGRRSPRDSRSPRAAWCRSTGDRCPRPLPGRRACPAASGRAGRARGSAMASTEVDHVLELGQHLLGRAVAQLLARVEARAAGACRRPPGRRARACSARAGRSPGAACAGARRSAGGRAPPPWRRDRRGVEPALGSAVALVGGERDGPGGRGRGRRPSGRPRPP